MSLPYIKAGQVSIRDLIKWDIDTNTNFKSIFPGTMSMQKVALYCLTSGKRLRPLITLSMTQTQGPEINGDAGYYHFPLFIEYVHNSSLIIDDLPCMDNDAERRGAPTVHIKYGEHVAQLVSYNLMITAMKHLSDGITHVRNSGNYTQAEYEIIYKSINEDINNNLGYQGICGGQMLDLLICTDKSLQSKSPREQRDLLLKIIKLKTGCLFSLSFVLGWVGSGSNINGLNDIKQAGYQFGTCYQIIDDLRDAKSDVQKNGGYNNICKYFSYNEIIDMFTNNIEQFAETLTRYNCWNPTLTELYNYMLQSFKSALQEIK